MEGGKSERHKTTVTEEESVLHRCTGEDSCINAGKTVALNEKKTYTFLTTLTSLMMQVLQVTEKKYVVTYYVSNIITILSLPVLKVVTKESRIGDF